MTISNLRSLNRGLTSFLHCKSSRLYKPFHDFLLKLIKVAPPSSNSLLAAPMKPSASPSGNVTPGGPNSKCCSHVHFNCDVIAKFDVTSGIRSYNRSYFGLKLAGLYNLPPSHPVRRILLLANPKFSWSDPLIQTSKLNCFFAEQN